MIAVTPMCKITEIYFIVDELCKEFDSTSEDVSLSKVK